MLVFPKKSVLAIVVARTDPHWLFPRMWKTAIDFMHLMIYHRNNLSEILRGYSKSDRAIYTISPIFY